MKKVLIAYIPVLHRGYIQFLEKYAQSVDEIFLLDRDILDEFSYIRKDMRSLEPSQVKKAVAAVINVPKISTLNKELLTQLAEENLEIFMPDEDIMHEVAQQYFPEHKITYDTVFLRWDKKKSLTEVQIEASQTISRDTFDQEMISYTHEIAKKSTDWWRQVGAVIVKDGKILDEERNRHVPVEQQQYFDGDARGNFHKGEHIDLTTSLHAEANLIARAAKEGKSLDGVSMYVFTFPCPNCAKLIAYSGIKKIYFEEGYGMFDGERILKDNGVEIIRVEK